MSRELIYIIQAVLAVVLIATILMQTKGSGLGATFGQSFSFYSTKRGFEKLLFNFTFIIAILFLLTSVLGLIL